MALTAKRPRAVRAGKPTPGPLHRVGSGAREVGATVCGVLASAGCARGLWPGGHGSVPQQEGRVRAWAGNPTGERVQT